MHLLSTQLVALACSAQSPPPPQPSPAAEIEAGTASTARAADDPLWDRSDLSGDWWGGRSALAKRGLTVDIGLTNFFQGVTSGGVRQEFAVGGNFNLELAADLELMDLIPGGWLLLHGESRYGETVNADSGALTPVNTRGYFPLTDPADESVPFAITELMYSQSFGELVEVSVGKMIVVDGDPIEFGGGRGVTQFFNSNFIYNAATSQTAPYASLGVAVDVQAASWMTVSGALFQTTDASTTSGFSDFDDGWTCWGQVATHFEIGSLPGGINVGGLYAFDNDFTRLGGTGVIVPGGFQLESVSDSWTIFAGAWQYLYAPESASTEPVDPSDGLADRRGFGAFARIGVGDPDTNPVDWSLSVGLGGRGLVPSRDNDTFGVGYYYTTVQDSRLLSLLPLASSTQGAEAYYSVALTPAVALTFNVQAIDGIVRNADTAMVLGMRLNIDF